ncbi:hypothetical protein BHE74_00043326 [Ensete ventricosum]|nr:hypothetical protein BHE74_00043326 [Ensete ventricosum]
MCKCSLLIHERISSLRNLLSNLACRKDLVRLFDKINQGSLREGKKLSNIIVEIHKRRQGSPRRRKGPIPGTRGVERFRSEEAFYENPLPDCLCQQEYEEFGNSPVHR